jgi:hypothetical protein
MFFEASGLSRDQEVPVLQASESGGAGGSAVVAGKQMT